MVIPSIPSLQPQPWQKGFFLYGRKSSEAEDRQVLSIESQTEELKKLAERLNFPIRAILSEAKSAKEPGRPVFNEMMHRIYSGEADGILCWKLDRLARNPVDGGSVIWAIKQHGIEIVTATQKFSQSDDNTILMYVEFGMAQKYIDDLSRNVKRGLKTKVQKGWYPGVAPLGYLNDRYNEKGDKRLLKDPERFPLLRRMWDLMLTGIHTPPQIVKIANTQWGFRTRQTKRTGGKPLARSAIYRMFKNPFYYGWFEYPKGGGQWYQGNHESIITREEYDEVQTLLGRRGNSRGRTLNFPFTGLIRCGDCGAMITAEEKHQLICSSCRFKFAYRNKDRCPRCQTKIETMKDPKFLHYIYYHCSKSKNPRCLQGSITSKQLEGEVDAFLSRISISQRFKDWAITYLQELHEQENKADSHIAKTQQRAYDDCLQRLKNLLLLKTSPENIDGFLLSDEEYSKQRYELLHEKSRLERFLHTDSSVPDWSQHAERTFEFASRARGWFAEGGSQTKKEILSTVGSNLTLRDKKLTIEARNPFLILEESLPPLKDHIPTIEPGILGGNIERNESLGLNGLTLRGGRDDVRTYERKAKSLVKKIYAFFKKVKEHFSIPSF